VAGVVGESGALVVEGHKIPPKAVSVLQFFLK
jgi:hypothetical protein